MAEGLAILTGVAALLAAASAMRAQRDAFAPPVVFGPMLIYCYAFVPAVVLAGGAASAYLTAEEATKVCLLNLAGVAAFLAGAWPRGLRRGDTRGIHNLQMRLTDAARRRLTLLGLLMGAVAVGAFCYNVNYTGGWLKVFSRGKPYVSSPTGYLGEMPMVAFPAALLFSLGHSARRLTLGRVLALLFILFPHVVMATLGGRRGPAFYTFGTLALCGYLITARRPSWSALMAGLAAVGLTMLFLVSNRANLGVGQENVVDVDAFWNAVVPAEVDGNHEFVFSAGMMNSADYHKEYGWGVRYFALLFVRPIPKQVWPTKYEDLGLGWMVNNPGMGNFEDFEWEEAVGFVPSRGTAGGFITDMYVEFSWLAVAPVFLIGALYSKSYQLSRRRGGVWTLVYIELLVLSVHLPAQSVQSWLYRGILLVGVTLVAWRALMGRSAWGARGRASPPVGGGPPTWDRPTPVDETAGEGELPPESRDEAPTVRLTAAGELPFEDAGPDGPEDPVRRTGAAPWPPREARRGESPKPRTVGRPIPMLDPGEAT